MPSQTGSDARKQQVEPLPRTELLFGAHKESVVVADGVDLTAPVLQDPVEADTGIMPQRAP